ncbi:hypothetical protein [Modestobacter roseus]|uniref:hypothetical protein n=1 Tax=Modestobacter roseus TaxID=1181884 RepID=UPI0012959B31|nr:hypothetical protein [Modestobacter roseus]MQA35907.1 hypothetical protein [Modestobacter roseus]
MLDYHAHCIALDEFTATLSAATFPEPDVESARERAVQAVAEEPGSALLGAFVHHLVAHAASDGAELELLRRAADLWARGRETCDRLGAIRADLETAMADPADPAAADRFNTAAVRAQELANEAIGLDREVDEIRATALAFPHLPPHPRQSDLDPERWGWGDLLLARRTDALVRALLRRAGDPSTLAFAVGAAGAYGASAAGSAYLAHAVGGPRRLHRHRDRLARTTVGAALAAQHPASRTPTAMAALLADELPAVIGQALQDALGEAFDLSRTPPPDLGLGHRRLVEHLRLLDRFELPAAPAPPGQVWLATLYGDPASPPPSLRPQDVDVVGQDGGGVAVEMGPGQPGSETAGNSDSAKVSRGCGIAVLLIILIDLLQAFVQCIGQWANGNRCTFWENMLLSKLWEQDPPSPHDPANPGVGQQELTAVGAAPQAAEFVGVLYDAHAQAWEAMSRARAFLVLTGLVYPTQLDGLPLHQQFLGLEELGAFVHREEPDPVATFHRRPTTPIERRDEMSSPYPHGAGPAVFLDPTSRLHAATVSFGLWAQVARGEQDSQNLDLDADRGFGHACWRAPSVHDDPVDVVVLGYDEQ